MKIIFSFYRENTIGGDQLEKQGLVVLTQKFLLIQERINALNYAVHHVIVVNMLKFGIMFLWNITKIMKEESYSIVYLKLIIKERDDNQVGKHVVN